MRHKVKFMYKGIPSFGDVVVQNGKIFPVKTTIGSNFFIKYTSEPIPGEAALLKAAQSIL